MGLSFIVVGSYHKLSAVDGDVPSGNLIVCYGKWFVEFDGLPT